MVGFLPAHGNSRRSGLLSYHLKLSSFELEPDSADLSMCVPYGEEIVPNYVVNLVMLNVLN